MDGGGLERRIPEPRRVQLARRFSLAGAANAAPDFVLGLTYVAVLVDRTLLPEAWVPQLARAVLIEFVVIHASGFLAWPWLAREWKPKRRALFVAALAGCYTFGLGIFALIQGALWPLAIFWGLMANRMLFVLVHEAPGDAEFQQWVASWAGGTTLYVLAVVIGVFGGVNDTTKALVIGFLYFTLMALSEVTLWAWVYRWQVWARRRAGR